MSTLAQMAWGQWFLAVLLISVCCFLILVILLQRGRGGGLVGAFGGAGGSSAFGAKTGDVFTWITVIVATLFVVLAAVGNFVFDESAAPARASTVQTVPPGGLEPTPLPISAGSIDVGDAPQPVSIKLDETTPESGAVGDVVLPEAGESSDPTDVTADPLDNAEEQPDQ